MAESTVYRWLPSGTRTNAVRVCASRQAHGARVLSHPTCARQRALTIITTPGR